MLLWVIVPFGIGCLFVWGVHISLYSPKIARGFFKKKDFYLMRNFTKCAVKPLLLGMESVNGQAYERSRERPAFCSCRLQILFLWTYRPRKPASGRRSQ